MSGWADRFATRWTTWYTRDLAPDVGARRCEEIRSDLFEHATAMGHGPAQQCSVLGRVLWGIPADLSWRRAAHMAYTRRAESGAPMKLQRVTTVVIIGLVLFELWAAIGSLTADGVGLRYSALFVLAAVLMCVGISQRATAPLRATILILVGAAAPAMIFYWMAPLFIPAFLAVAALVIVSQRRRSSVEPAI